MFEEFTARIGTDEQRAWMKKAACRGMGPQLFYPDDEDEEDDVWPGEHVEPAKAVCNGCSVKAVCLEWAIRHTEDMGVWGGESARERVRVRRRRYKADRRDRGLSA